MLLHWAIMKVQLQHCQNWPIRRKLNFCELTFLKLAQPIRKRHFQSGKICEHKPLYSEPRISSAPSTILTSRFDTHSAASIRFFGLLPRRSSTAFRNCPV